MTQAARLVKMIVYGCQMNFAEAERMEGQLWALGFESTEDASAESVSRQTVIYNFLPNGFQEGPQQ